MTWTKASPTLMLFLLLLQGCGLYSFSGISLSPEVKTFFIQFQSDVALGPPDLSEKLQQKLNDELVQRTPLQQVYTQGDLQMEGVITQFQYVSVAPMKSGVEKEDGEATTDRLTITVQMTYTNTYDNASSFSKKTFSQSSDMAATTSRSDEEPRLIDDIFTKLVADIINDTVAAW